MMKFKPDRFLSKEEIFKIVDEMPVPKKQEILDLLKAGETIGYIKGKLDLDLMVVCEVINRQIKGVDFIDYDVK